MMVSGGGGEGDGEMGGADENVETCAVSVHSQNNAGLPCG